MFKEFKIIRNNELTPKIGTVLNGFTGKFKGVLYGNYSNNCELSDEDWKQQAQDCYQALLNV